MIHRAVGLIRSSGIWLFVNRAVPISSALPVSGS